MHINHRRKNKSRRDYTRHHKWYRASDQRYWIHRQIRQRRQRDRRLIHHERWEDIPNREDPIDWWQIYQSQYAPIVYWLGSGFFTPRNRVRFSVGVPLWESNVLRQAPWSVKPVSLRIEWVQFPPLPPCSCSSRWQSVWSPSRRQRDRRLPAAPFQVIVTVKRRSSPKETSDRTHSCLRNLGQ